MRFANYVGPTEAARILGISRERVNQLCKDGKLKYVRTPLGRLIERRCIEERAEAMRRLRERKEEAAG